MNINIENYEEFFLLYADNELTAAQRQIVEMFVDSNPHLKNEFQSILLTVQQPDDISLNDKSFLFKRPLDHFIDQHNYEEKFVACHDGELSDAEIELTKAFVDENEGLRETFELVKQARLEAEVAIVYPDKEALYRHSAKVRYMGLVRFVAAAGVLVFVIWFGRNYTQTDKVPAPLPIASTSAVKTPDQQQPRISVKNPSAEDQQKVLRESVIQNEVVEKKIETAAQYAGHRPAQEKSVVKAQQVAAVNDGNLVQHDSRTKPTEIKNALDVQPDLPQQEIKQIASIALHVDIDATPRTEPAPRVQYASFGNEPANDYVFFDIPAENLRRSKVGIFIKKVKRTIDRNNPVNRLFNGDEIE